MKSATWKNAFLRLVEEISKKILERSIFSKFLRKYPSQLRTNKNHMVFTETTRQRGSWYLKWYLRSYKNSTNPEGKVDNNRQVDLSQRDRMVQILFYKNIHHNDILPLIVIDKKLFPEKISDGFKFSELLKFTFLPFSPKIVPIIVIIKFWGVILAFDIFCYKEVEKVKKMKLKSEKLRMKS